MRQLSAEIRRRPDNAGMVTALEAAIEEDEALDQGLIGDLPRRSSRRVTGNPVENRSAPAHEPTGITSWPVLDRDAALYGLAGDFVRMIEPHTEADPAALLVQVLVAAGNAIGPGPHFRVERDIHALNLFAIIVGPTAKGRKGTSWGHIRALFKSVDEVWSNTRIASGLSSGEGLIWAVRDAIERPEPLRETGTRKITGYQTLVEDPGIDDKRLLVLETEFASVLRIVGRDGNTLSPIVRQAWDTGDLRSLTKNSPAKATGAHISIIGHITMDELRRYLTQTETGNGFANRFQFVGARRSNVLPEGGRLECVDQRDMLRRFTEAVERARGVDEMVRDEGARELWQRLYVDLSEGRPGLLGSVTSRAEAQTMRLACIYALLDCSSIIQERHLAAAVALWKYCEDSARFIFGDSIGDTAADQILRGLRGASLVGMTRTEINNLLGRNVDAARILEALRKLQELGLARFEIEHTNGRPAERWFASSVARGDA